MPYRRSNGCVQPHEDSKIRVPHGAREKLAANSRTLPSGHQVSLQNARFTVFMRPAGPGVRTKRPRALQLLVSVST
jgi:hypothetical protein